MRAWRAWGAAAVGLALTLALMSVTWTLDANSVGKRLDNVVAPFGYHFETPERATLRLFPEPILDVFALRLADGEGRVVFTASTAAFRLAIPDLIAGRYAIARARVKDPEGTIDLDGVESALPLLAAAPPAGLLQFRGGRIRLVSRKLGVDETVSPFAGVLKWPSPDGALMVQLNGPWRGQESQIDATLASPAAFVAGEASDLHFSLESPGVDLVLDGVAAGSARPSFEGKIDAKLEPLAQAARWAGLASAGLSEGPLTVSGSVSLAPGQYNLDDGKISLSGQSFDGAAGLQKGADGWQATATLAADRLDLSALLGPPPELLGPNGGWSEVRALGPAPPLDLDMRLSATTTTWGHALFTEAAVALTRRGDETRLRILEAGYANGALSGDVIVRDCATACGWRATLSLVNADAAVLTGGPPRNPVAGAATVDLDIGGSGETPSQWASTLYGEVGLTLRDGALLGVNFEEALRRSQRRSLDLGRDLLVGQTMFRKLEARLALTGGRGVFREAKFTGPGVALTALGDVDVAAQALDVDVEARQADVLGHVSPEGASLGLALRGPWRKPDVATRSPPD